MKNEDIRFSKKAKESFSSPEKHITSLSHFAYQDFIILACIKKKTNFSHSSCIINIFCCCFLDMIIGRVIFKAWWPCETERWFHFTGTTVQETEYPNAYVIWPTRMNWYVVFSQSRLGSNFRSFIQCFTCWVIIFIKFNPRCIFLDYTNDLWGRYYQSYCVRDERVKVTIVASPPPPLPFPLLKWVSQLANGVATKSSVLVLNPVPLHRENTLKGFFQHFLNRNFVLNSILSHVGVLGKDLAEKWTKNGKGEKLYE